MAPSSARIISRSVVFFTQYCGNYCILQHAITLQFLDIFITIIKINSDYITLNHIEPVFLPVPVAALSKA